MNNSATCPTERAALQISPALLERLACPDCRGRLTTGGGGLSCTSCQREFPVAAEGTLPILFSPDSEFFSREHDYGAWRRPEQTPVNLKSYRSSRRLPQTSVSAITDAAWVRYLQAIAGKWVLNAGSGTHLIRSNLEHCVNLDICPHSNVEVVGDAHHLPFADESFDAAIYQAVFAHLRNPFQAASEIIRVLRPGGLVWCTVPFAHPVCRAPRDFFRFSPDGLQSIFDGLSVVELQASGGPFRVIARYAENAAEALFPGKLGSAALWLVAWSLQPFKYFDDALVKRSPECASAFYFVARKPGG